MRAAPPRHAAPRSHRPLSRARAAAVTVAATVVAIGAGTATAFGAAPPVPVQRPGDCAVVAIGSTGPMVARLQALLGVATDGDFGPITQAALRRWQAAHRLPATGRVDAATWRALPGVPLICGAPITRLVPTPNRPCPTLQRGVIGPAVAALQRQVGVATDGDFGPITAGAVARAQRPARLGPPGVVGPQTWSLLHLAGTPACPTTAGAQGTVVHGAAPVPRPAPTAPARPTPRPTSAVTPTPAPARPTPKPAPAPVPDPVLEARRAAVRAQVARAVATLATSPTTATDPVAATAVRNALGQLGTPYVWGGAAPGGFDCSGLVFWAYGRAGVEVPRVADAQYAAGLLVPLAQARPGDLVFWGTDVLDPRTIGHVGIYLGAGRMVEAPTTGERVRIRAIGGPTMFPMAARPSALLALPLREGALGWSVRQVQRALVASGQRLAVDGAYGPITAGAVRTAQQRAGLPATGVVDAATWAALTRDRA